MILAIDQGTSGTTCLVVDTSGRVVSRASRELRQHFPAPGMVEHDLDDVWADVQKTAGEALAGAGCRPGGLAAIGVTNQRETVCVWDPKTGRPLHRAIVWQDRRTATRCTELRRSGLEPWIRAATGLTIDPYFSATKIEWLLDNVQGLRARARNGGAVFGTVDAWILFNLTGEARTDVSNASRTMLFDLRSFTWSPELCDYFGVPIDSLPEVRPSIGGFGTSIPEKLHGHAAPIRGVAGDQQAALFGQACEHPGDAKITYGTGSFLLLNSGSAHPGTHDGIVTTVAWQEGCSKTFALEASIFVTGAAVQWLRDGLGIIDDVADSEALAISVADNGGVFFVPALTGLGSPHWNPDARGTIVGLTRGAGAAHLARAALEAIAYQARDAVRCLEDACGLNITELRVDGGASANRWLMQFQADVLGVPVRVASTKEATAPRSGLTRCGGVRTLSRESHRPC